MNFRSVEKLLECNILNGNSTAEMVVYQDASTAQRVTRTIPPRLAAADPPSEIGHAMQTALMVVAVAVRAGVARHLYFVMSRKAV